MIASAAPAENKIVTPWSIVGGSACGLKKIAAHQPLFCEGDAATHLYEVLEGVLCCYKVFADGRRQVVTFAFPGDLVGFGHGEEYRFNCDAVASVRVHAIPKTSLLREIKEKPELGERLLELATMEVASMQDHSMLLARKSALEKIASFLVGLAGRSGDCDKNSMQFQLPMTRADIADFLGLTIETVSRAFTKLRVRGIIELPFPATLVIRDMEALRDMAESEEGFHY